MKKTVILVSVGILQDYIKDNIEQLLQLGYENIHIITEKKYFAEIEKYSSITLFDASELDTDNFDKNFKLDSKFRNGFWKHTSKRFFLIYEYMKMCNIENVIHLENDVLLYSDMDYEFEDKIYITMDSRDRCIPGIVYIPRYNLLTKLIENYNFSKNDMVNLGTFYKNAKDIIKTFPIIDNSIDKCIYNENYEVFNSIFDGAAIGQYLGGVDPRNIRKDTVGFVNTTCVIKYNKYEFKWIKKGEYSFPHIEINNKLIPINNIHFHCKNLKKFRMDNLIFT